MAATGTGPLHYQWRRNGVGIAGATAAGYTTPATTLADNGVQYDVVVSNVAGTVTSQPATLTVGLVAVAPMITSQPADAGVVAGQPASFSVAATGTAPLSYQWRSNGTPITGATQSSYTTPATAAADNGRLLSVVVSNAAGSAVSDGALLTVTAAPVAPAIITQPANATVSAGQTASFTVTATGTAPLSYQWRRNGADIVGATAASYTTPATLSADSGALFSVVVSNAAGSATSANATLTVTSAAVAPTIVTQPASVSVTAPQAASFSVTAAGTAPLAYQWRRNGIAIPGATSATYIVASTATGDSGAQFSVQVSNAAGSVTSAPATLSVGAAMVAPVIATPPTSKTVVAGQTASFSVTATGSAPLAYQWRRNGSAIAGATGASYTTPATVVGDSGALFSVVVSNAAGSATSTNATLTVTPAPVAPAIVTPPANATVAAGAAATFSVMASGTAPLAYQWSRNGTPIVGATGASYTTPITTAGDNGASFTVQVSNSAGSVGSAAATLTVSVVWTGIRQDGAPYPLQFGTGPKIATSQARAVATDAQGNVIIAGATSGTFAVVSPAPPELYTPFVAKYGPGGVLLWAREVFDTRNNNGVFEVANGVATDPSGNIYVTGEVLSTGLPGEVPAGSLDVFVAKFDGNGNRLWAHQFGSSRWDRSRGIAVDASGNAFVTGFTDGQLPGQAPAADGDFFIAKFDTGGTRLWLKQIDLGRNDEANAIALDGPGNLYVAGTTYQQAGEFSGNKAFVAKYNGSGNQQWISLIGEGPFPLVVANAVAASTNGNAIYLAGRTYQDLDVVGQPRVAPQCCTTGDAFVARFNGSGTQQWVHNLAAQTLSGPRYFNDEALGIVTNAAGSAVFVTGYTDGVMPGETSKGAEDMFAARYEGDGTRTWVRQFGAGLPAGGSSLAQYDIGFGIAMDPNGDLFIAGATVGSFGTPGPNIDRWNWFLLKMKPADGSLD